MLADGQDQIENRRAVELLLRKAENSRSFGDNGGLSATWNTFKRDDFEKIVRNLDVYNSGSINYQQLAICCILMQSPLPDDQKLDQLKRALQQVEVSKDCFMQSEIWFDKTEMSKDRDYSHPYPRADLIKEVVFDLFEKNGSVNVINMTKIMKSADVATLKPGAKTYGDLLMCDVKK